MASYSQTSQDSSEYGAPQQEAAARLSPHQAAQPTLSPYQAVATKSLAQTFGLDIRAAILTMLVDVMVFGGAIGSVGVLIPLGIFVAVVLGFIVYKIQTKWYGDDHDSGLIKALIVSLLTAIPVPLTPLVAVPGGALGLISMLRRK